MPRLKSKFIIAKEAQVTIIDNSPSFSALAASSALSIKFLALLVICGNLAYQFLTTFCSINKKEPLDLTKRIYPHRPHSHLITTLYNLPRLLHLLGPDASRLLYVCLAFLSPSDFTVIWKGKQTLRVRRPVRNL